MTTILVRCRCPISLEDLRHHCAITATSSHRIMRLVQFRQPSFKGKAASRYGTVQPNQRALCTAMCAERNYSRPDFHRITSMKDSPRPPSLAAVKLAVWPCHVSEWRVVIRPGSRLEQRGLQHAGPRAVFFCARRRMRIARLVPKISQMGALDSAIVQVLCSVNL